MREAAGAGAEFVALPEMFAFLRREGSEFPCAQGVDGEMVSAVRDWARELAVRILVGTFPERVADSDRVHNTSVLVSPEGEIEAIYRKIHLFDVDLVEGSYRESTRIAAGDEVVVAKTPVGGIGLSVCYDVRFPELYREMAARDARLVTVPSAFARETGKDHWEVLLRARAIENQVFVIAPAQCGRHSADRSSYGRSLVIDPWGLVLAQLGDQPGVAIAECDLAEQERIRTRLPALGHRRL